MEARTEPRRKATSRPRAKAKKSPVRSASKSAKSAKAAKTAKKVGKAQDPEAAMMAAWQKSMTPAKGHERLEPLVGKFDVRSKFWMQPGQPPSEGSGTSVQTWILGGRYVQQVYNGDAMGMPFEGVGHTGYDNVTQKYVGSWMDSMGTGLMTSVGIGKPTAKKIEFESQTPDPMTGKTAKLRSVIRIKDKNQHSFETWMRGRGGKEFRNMLIEYKRK